MAKRPIFIPNMSKDGLVKEVYVDFDWSPGFSITQKEKSIQSLHLAAKEKGIAPVLEISTKSPLTLGKELSAFNLSCRINGIFMVVESAFQGSKVFEKGGPFTDIYEMPGKAAKKDERLRDAGNLVGFDLLGDRWGLEPKTAFYDWIYINAIQQNPSLVDQLLQYNGFSDIEFNSEKSINCQARSAALYITLRKRGLLQNALLDKKNYLKVISKCLNIYAFNQSSLPGL